MLFAGEIAMDETADYFRQKAKQCRRLADAHHNPRDPVVANLLAMSVEFEARAVALAAEEAAAAQSEQMTPPPKPDGH